MLNRCQYFIPTVLMVDTGLDHLPLTPWAESQSFTWCLDLTTAVESNWLRPPQKKTKHDQHGVHLLYLQGSRVLHLHPTHVDLGAVDFQKSLPYTKQAPPCYDMLQPCFLIDPKKNSFADAFRPWVACHRWPRLWAELHSSPWWPLLKVEFLTRKESWIFKVLIWQTWSLRYSQWSNLKTNQNQ